MQLTSVEELVELTHYGIKVREKGKEIIGIGKNNHIFKMKGENRIIIPHLQNSIRKPYLQQM